MYTCNSDFFKIIDNEYNAYWLGFLMADGCVLEYRNRKTNKLKAMGLQLSLSTVDRLHIENFINDIGSNTIIKDNKIMCKDTECYSSKVTICNTEMCRDLINLNCTPRKSLTLKYPIDLVPKEFEHDFIRGYFDGDGSISYSENMQYYKERQKEYLTKNFYVNILGTENFLNYLIYILNNNGIKSTLKHYKSNAFEIRITSVENLNKFYNYIYKDVNRYLDRKYLKFIDAFTHYDLAIK